jgi:hypothetical protein
MTVSRIIMLIFQGCCENKVTDNLLSFFLGKHSPMVAQMPSMSLEKFQKTLRFMWAKKTSNP